MYRKLLSLVLVSILCVAGVAQTEAPVHPTKEAIQSKLSKKFQKQLDKHSIVAAWDREEEATKYTLYYGTKSHQYTNKIEISPEETFIQLDALETGVHYFFALTYSVGDFESEKTDEISFTGGFIKSIEVKKDKTILTIEGQKDWFINLGYINKHGRWKYIKTIRNNKEVFEIKVNTNPNREYKLIEQGQDDPQLQSEANNRTLHWPRDKKQIKSNK